MLEAKRPSVIPWGVIGCGQIAVDKSLPGLLAAKDARLAAVADPLKPRRALALEAAVIAAAKAKKAILCEKPLGNNASEVREMVRSARGNGVPLMTAYLSRFSDIFLRFFPRHFSRLRSF